MVPQVVHSGPFERAREVNVEIHVTVFLLQFLAILDPLLDVLILGPIALGKDYDKMFLQGNKHVHQHHIVLFNSVHQVN